MRLKKLTHSWVGYVGLLTVGKYEGNVGYIEGSVGAELDECNWWWFCWADLGFELVNGVLSPVLVYKYVSGLADLIFCF